MEEARNLIIIIGETEEEANKASEMFEELAKNDKRFAELNDRKNIMEDCLYIESTYNDPIRLDNGMELEFWDVQDELYEIFKDYKVSIGNESVMDTKEKDEKKAETYFDCITDFEHYNPETDEFLLADAASEDYYMEFGKVSADVFRDEDGIIKYENVVDAIETKEANMLYDCAGITLYLYDSEIYLLETNMDLYDEGKNVFEVQHSNGNKVNDITIPADLFKNDAGEFESKQVSYKPDGSDAYIFVHLKK